MNKWFSYGVALVRSSSTYIRVRLRASSSRALYLNHFFIGSAKRWFVPCVVLFALLSYGSFFHGSFHEAQKANVLKELIISENQALSTHLSYNISEHILELSSQYDIDPLLILAVIKTESNFQPHVVSYAGAVGLMQVMPIVIAEVGTDLAQQRRSSYSLLMDPKINIELGVRYLDYLRKIYGDDWYTILSAYNMGPTYVSSLRLKSRRPPARYYHKVMQAYRDFRRAHADLTTA